HAAVRGGDPVNDLFVDRDADGRGKAAIALEGRQGAVLADEALHFLVDLERRHPWLDDVADQLDDVRQDVPAAAHETDLTVGLEHDHRRAPAASRRACRIFSTAPSPDTVRSRPRSR